MFPSISNAEFYQKSKQTHKQKHTPLMIIDVRESDEFAEGHIPDAIKRSLSTLVKEKDSFIEDDTYCVICHSGKRATQACNYFNGDGIQVVNVLGGMSEWRGC